MPGGAIDRTVNEAPEIFFKLGTMICLCSWPDSTYLKWIAQAKESHVPQPELEGIK
jgi:hypothetical protein